MGRKDGPGQGGTERTGVRVGLRVCIPAGKVQGSSRAGYKGGGRRARMVALPVFSSFSPQPLAVCLLRFPSFPSFRLPLLPRSSPKGRHTPSRKMKTICGGVLPYSTTAYPIYWTLPVRFYPPKASFSIALLPSAQGTISPSFPFSQTFDASSILIHRI